MKKKVLLDGRVHEKERLFVGQMRLLEECKTSVSNKQKIREFVQDKQVSGVVNASITPYLASLIRLFSFANKDLAKISERDLKNYFAKMQNSKSERGTPFSSTTIDNHKRNLKFFYKWFNGGKQFPLNVEWIKESHRRKVKLADEMISEEEVEQLIRNTASTRDQAIIATLYDSAARVGEFCNVHIKDVKFDSLGALMFVNGKTGPRSIRLIHCVPYIQNWLQVHPFREDPNTFLWYNLQAQKWAEVNRQTLARIIDRALKRTKIDKKMHPHLFRHSRLTALAPKITEQVLKGFAGWTPDSRMAAVYVHISGKSLDDALAKASGIEIPEETKESRLAAITCPRCKTKNAGVAKYCSNCSMVIDQSTALQIEQIQAQDENATMAIMSRMQQLKLQLEDVFGELETLRKNNKTVAEPIRAR